MAQRAYSTLPAPILPAGRRGTGRPYAGCSARGPSQIGGSKGSTFSSLLARSPADRNVAPGTRELSPFSGEVLHGPPTGQSALFSRGMGAFSFGPMVRIRMRPNAAAEGKTMLTGLA